MDHSWGPRPPSGRPERYLVAMRIAIIVAGDEAETLQATPLLGTLRSAFPDAWIGLAHPAVATGVVPGITGTDATFAIRALDRPSPALATARLWFQLRRMRCDVAFICGRDPGLRLAVFLNAIGRRIGEAHGPSSVLLSDRLTASSTDNSARTWTRLATLLGVSRLRNLPHYAVTPELAQIAQQRLVGGGLDDQHLVVAIAPGRSRWHEKWNPERFAHLGNQLARRHGANVVIVGSEDDRDDAAAVRIDLAAPHIDVCGELTVEETAAVLADCDLLVGTDSFLLHLAAAVGTSTVGLFHRGDRPRSGPYGREHRGVQSLGSHWHRTLDAIRVDDVLAAIESL